MSAHGGRAPGSAPGGVQTTRHSTVARSRPCIAASGLALWRSATGLHKKHDRTSTGTRPRVPEHRAQAQAWDHGPLTLAEAVLEAAVHQLQVAHAAGAGGLAADGLHAPVVCTRAKPTPAGQQRQPRCSLTASNQPATLVCSCWFIRLRICQWICSIICLATAVHCLAKCQAAVSEGLFASLLPPTACQAAAPAALPSGRPMHSHLRILAAG